MEELREFLDKYNVKYTIEDNYIIADKIDLSNNQITELPESFGYIKCDELRLDNNLITELPESFGNIKCYYLFLYNNRITKLPKSFGNINFFILWLNNNQITKLPKSIGNIKCISIRLHNNEISELPESIGNIKCNELWLGGNKLKELPESIGNLRCGELRLDHNNISKLPESIGDIKCNKFILSNNIIETPIFDKYKFDKIEITDQYIHCDRLLTWYESIRTIGGCIVYVGYYGNYVATKDNINFAHGNSIREAITDLLFKISDRDKSKYIGLDKDKQLTIEECIVMYRVITGACSSGVNKYLQSKIFDKKTTINQIYSRLNEDDYGYNEFKEFFNLK